MVLNTPWLIQIPRLNLVISEATSDMRPWEMRHIHWAGALTCPCKFGRAWLEFVCGVKNIYIYPFGRCLWDFEQLSDMRISQVQNLTCLCALLLSYLECSVILLDLSGVRKFCLVVWFLFPKVTWRILFIYLLSSLNIIEKIACSIHPASGIYFSHNRSEEIKSFS